jgi:hypothetical protein
MMCFICGNPIIPATRKHWIYCAECAEKISNEDENKIKRLKPWAILIVPYLQVLFYYGNKYHRSLEYETSAGEKVKDHSSKKVNLIEGVGMYIAIMIAMWFFIGYGEMQLGQTWMGLIGYAIMGIGGIWAIFLSPYYHMDEWHGIGFSKPLEYINLYKSGSPEQRKTLIILLIVIGIFSLLMVWVNWSYILIRFGLRGRTPELYRYFTQTTGGQMWSLVMGLGLYIVLVLFLIRWDNLISTFKSLMIVAIFFWSAIVITGVIYATSSNDWTKFEEFVFISSDPDSFISHTGFYAIWGMIQQWLFLGYFNARLRKGIPNQKIGPVSGRIITSILTGLTFGLIHLPAWPLSTLTFIGGCLFGWFYQEDKYRNLFIMGFVHGVGGTLVSQTTPMVMVVGPWSV